MRLAELDWMRQTNSDTFDSQYIDQKNLLDISDSGSQNNFINHANIRSIVRDYRRKTILRFPVYCSNYQLRIFKVKTISVLCLELLNQLISWL